MAEISEKEVKAALSAWNNYNNSGPVAEDRSDAMRVALEAAARVRAEANAEPVAWTGSWSLNALSHGHEGFIYPEETEAHPIPLFTHAAPQPSGTVEALKRITQLKEVRRGGGAFDYEPALSAMEMYEIAFDALSALTAGKSEHCRTKERK